MIGCVYFIQEGHAGAIKIGWSLHSAETRRQGMQTSNSNQLRILGSYPARAHAEREWHKRFAKANKLGEWFWPSDDLVAAICETLDSPPPVGDATPLRTIDFRDWMAGLGLGVSDVAKLSGYAPGTIWRELEYRRNATINPRMAGRLRSLMESAS